MTLNLSAGVGKFSCTFVGPVKSSLVYRFSGVVRSIIQLLILGFVMTVLAHGGEPVREIRHSPDKKYLVAWFDQDVGEPLRDMRSVVLCASDDSAPLFSFVSNPRYTDAAWNASSNLCIIADAPDNGGPVIWLLRMNEKGDWQPEVLDPFASLSKEFYDIPDRASLFRPSLLKIEWLSETKVRFRGYCNLGTYFMTVDTTMPGKAAEVEKLSDKLLRE
ncbi:hypothetical protein DES53_104277 [Roseimicrobium gellanilyticum]|uniref:Uncharacterized protein n=1 Tax=Roseimicrobium gellanilyticum TaxID=748857 RepID=A0A366HNU6_9BACT|nr:hypothetical protein DES53_104277 [Roseimicrobium gellanilyticum]